MKTKTRGCNSTDQPSMMELGPEYQTGAYRRYGQNSVRTAGRPSLFRSQGCGSSGCVGCNRCKSIFIPGQFGQLR